MITFLRLLFTDCHTYAHLCQPSEIDKTSTLPTITSLSHLTSGQGWTFAFFINVGSVDIQFPKVS